MITLTMINSATKLNYSFLRVKLKCKNAKRSIKLDSPRCLIIVAKIISIINGVC